MTEIYISDLAKPVLNQQQQGAMDYGETLEISFDRDAILAEAAAPEVRALVASLPTMNVGRWFPKMTSPSEPT